MAAEYLFLCSMGQNRSPTAAEVAAKIVEERGFEAEVCYGGIDFVIEECQGDKSGEACRKYRERFQQYDMIFVMESYMQRALLKAGVEKRKIQCLDIPDEYKRNEPLLVEILENSLRARIGFKDTWQSV